MRTILFLLLLWTTSTFCNDSDIILVVSKQSPIETVSKSDLKKLYIGKQNTINKNFTNPTILKVKKTHKKFLKQYLKLNSRQFARIWQKLVFTGKAQMPKQYVSEKELITMLKENPERVGYIQRKHITEELREIAVTP